MFRNASLSILLTLGALTACQSPATGPGPVATSSDNAALPTMERIAVAAQKCWFAKSETAFKSYRMANELNSYSGRPRILLVPARSPESKPLLVVHAEGNPARLEAFGPLMESAQGRRIAADVQNWAQGNSTCSKSA